MFFLDSAKSDEASKSWFKGQLLKECRHPLEGVTLKGRGGGQLNVAQDTQLPEEGWLMPTPNPDLIRPCCHHLLA